MSNITKYWILLESLDFAKVGVQQTEAQGRLQANLKTLQKYIKMSPQEMILEMTKDLHLPPSVRRTVSGWASATSVDNDKPSLYVLYTLYFLLELTKYTNFASDAKEDLISTRHKNLFIAAVQDVAEWGLHKQLHPSFGAVKNSVFNLQPSTRPNYDMLQLSLECFSKLLFIKPLHIGKAMEEPLLLYMASIYTILLAHDAQECHLDDTQLMQMQAKLQRLWLELPKMQYFRNLMLLKGMKTLPQSIQQRLHRELLLRLWSSGGFTALLFAIVESKKDDKQSVAETVAHIVGQPGYSTRAQHSLINQIFKYLLACPNNEELMQNMGAALLSLRRLYDIREENRGHVKEWLSLQVKELVHPDEEACVMEYSNFVALVSLLFHVFCTSSVESLPSELLIAYLPLLISLYGKIHVIPNVNRLTEQLGGVITHCLHNRSPTELRGLLEKLCRQQSADDWVQLDSRVSVRENPLQSNELRIVLDDGDTVISEKCDVIPTVVDLLMNSNYNILKYEFFMTLFRMLQRSLYNEITAGAGPNIELLQTQEDIMNTLTRDISILYGEKVQIVQALERLIQHKPLRSLLIENVRELLRSLNEWLQQYTDHIDRLSEMDSSTLLIILILTKEIVENANLPMQELSTNRSLLTSLQKLQAADVDSRIRQQTLSLIALLGSEPKEQPTTSLSQTEFAEARELIESKESYLQVAGIEKLLKLVQCRDAGTLSNGHVIIALALNTLKSPESYTFLNCVRLFAALVYVMEAEVLDILCDEYLSDANNMDFRLVVGEAVLKVCHELGPLCYKYKNILLNCFMSGARSTLDEFRMSSFANLAQLCRILTYQVHNYFQELLHLIDCELTTGIYLPAKRASILVLSELLEGMENLFEYAEMLLPIYRLLKVIEAGEGYDEKMRLHASNGLRALNEKCKKLFLEERPSLEKEIKIFGIKEKSKERTSRRHILELD